MPQTQPAIAIVDDEVFVQRAVARWLSTADWLSLTFPSAEAVLQTGLQAAPDCLVFDVWLLGMTGVEVLEHLAATCSTLPTVIVTGRDDLQMRMRAMQARAAAPQTAGRAGAPAGRPGGAGRAASE